jgi:hypothetical protein
MQTQADREFGWPSAWLSELRSAQGASAAFHNSDIRNLEAVPESAAAVAREVAVRGTVKIDKPARIADW